MRRAPGSAGEPPMASSGAEVDVVVVGSGAAGLSAALAAAVSGARVCVLEKSPLLGGTTALSGGCIWAPMHHHMHALAIDDSRREALEYIHAVAPAGWHNEEAPLWSAFVDAAPQMLRFLEIHSPLRFVVNREPDPYAEAPGGKPYGRNVSPRPVRMSTLGAWRERVRAPAWPQLLNYEEIVDGDYFSHPRRMLRRTALRALFRRVSGRRTAGGALVAGLLKGCLDHGVELWLEAPATRLVRDATGRVSGVELGHRGEPRAIGARAAVVLASGGFEWNREMMARYLPGPLAWCASPRTNTGDGQRMAEAVGARLERMDQALMMGTVPVAYEGHDDHGRPAFDYFLPHSMIVNRHGRRFVNEKQMNIGLAWAERDPATGVPIHLPAWRIYDAQFVRKYRHALPPGEADGRALHRAETLPALAARIGVDAASLVATAARFSAFARAGRDADFGRGEALWDRVRGGDPSHCPSPTLGTIEEAPFYAMPFHVSVLGTKGGPRTDARARVLDAGGRPIAGLYAAGNVMANCFGTKAVGAGTTLGPCLTWGYVAGRDAVAAPLG